MANRPTNADAINELNRIDVTYAQALASIAVQEKPKSQLLTVVMCLITELDLWHTKLPSAAYITTQVIPEVPK